MSKIQIPKKRKRDPLPRFGQRTTGLQQPYLLSAAAKQQLEGRQAQHAFIEAERAHNQQHQHDYMRAHGQNPVIA